MHARLIVRFLADLVNASVLLPDCIIAMFDAFLSVVTETDVPQVSQALKNGIIWMT